MGRGTYHGWRYNVGTAACAVACSFRTCFTGGVHALCARRQIRFMASPRLGWCCSRVRGQKVGPAVCSDASWKPGRARVRPRESRGCITDVSVEVPVEKKPNARMEVGPG